jgi:hypothetical protein
MLKLYMSSIASPIMRFKTRYPGIAGEITETDIKFCQKAVSATAEIVNRHLEQTVENVHIKDRDDEDLHR